MAKKTSSSVTYHSTLSTTSAPSKTPPKRNMSIAKISLAHITGQEYNFKATTLSEEAKMEIGGRGGDGGLGGGGGGGGGRSSRRTAGSSRRKERKSGEKVAVVNLDLSAM